jgi:hypothetical protein
MDTVENIKTTLNDGISSYFITNYEVPIIKGVVTENIFQRLTNTIGRSISKTNMTHEDIHGCIVKPDYSKVVVNYDNFIALNFFDKEYIKKILNIDNYYDIFNYDKHYELRSKFKNKIERLLPNEKQNILNIQHNINKLISSTLPFKYTIIDNDTIECFINTVNHNNIYDIEWKGSDNTLDNTLDNTTITLNNSVNYLVPEIGFGFGDFIQRYTNHLYPLLNYSNNNYILNLNKDYGYMNNAHGSIKYFTMYDFPLFSFGVKNDNINKKYLSNIQFINFSELLIYDKNFFCDFDSHYILSINLSTCPIQALSKPSARASIVQKYILSLRAPLRPTISNLEFKNFSDNEIVILHFRRGDYVNSMLNTHRDAKRNRTMSTFTHIINKISYELDKKGIHDIDAVIISDHFDYSKIQNNDKKYIPILFDYADIEVNSVITSKKVNIHIKDKLVGITSEEDELLTIKYLASSKYIIGNMSCFPGIIARAFGNNIINLSGGIDANIKTTEDLDKLL